MAKKGSGGAGGAKLATGYISLNVRYASAMGQIASDFDSIDKRAKSTGESITKNLVAGADKAKAQVKELGAAYEQQRQKVEGLKAALQDLRAKQDAASAAEKAATAARAADAEKRKAFIQQEINLQEQLRRAMDAALNRKGLNTPRSDPEARKAAIADDAAVQAVYKKQAALEAKRKKEVQDLTRLEKELSAARSAANAPAYAKGVQAINTEIAKGRTLLEQYGKATEDAARKQQLANTTITSATAAHRTFGQKISQAFSGSFIPNMQAAGTKGVNAFRQAFNHHMNAARSESTHHGKQIASGLLMGLTPQFLTAAGAGLAVGAAFKSGFSRLEDIDTAKLKLDALGYSAADVSATTGAAMNSVIGTAYSFSDAMNAATVAMAAGIKPGAELEKHLTLIGDAAALTGEDYATVAETINRVTQFGIVSQREIRPLISKNIPVLQWLREYYVKQTGNQKITVGDIREMITNKMISADVFETVMSEKLHGMAKELGRKTVKGAFSNMWVQVGKVTASMIEPIFGSIPGAINKVADTLSRWSEQIKPMMANAVGWIKKQWATIGPALGRAIEWIKDMWAKMWPHVWFYIDKFVTMWKEMWPQLIAHVQPLLAAFRRLWDALWPIMKPIVAFAGLLAYEFIKHLPAIAQFATNLINWLATAVNWLRVNFWPWLKDNWKKFTTQVSDAWGTVKTFSDKVIGFFDAIKSGTSKTWTWLEDKFKWMKDNIPGLTALLKAFGLGGDGVALMSSSKPMGNVPMPAGLRDTEGRVSGAQSRYTAAQVMQRWPDITTIGGARASGTAKNTHDIGQSIDIPISASNKAEGDAINQWLLANAKTLGIVYTIWRDKGTQTGLGGRNVGSFNQPGHQDHIDVHFDGSVALQSSSTAMGGGGLWDKIAAKESSGNWNDNNSGGHSTSSGAPRGGLQITDGTWKSYGGTEFAPNAAMATKEQQIAVAKRIAFTGYKGVAPQGLGAWEVVTQGKVAGVNASMSASDFGGIANLNVSHPLSGGDTGGLLGGGGPFGGGGGSSTFSLGNVWRDIQEWGISGLPFASGGFGGIGGSGFVPPLTGPFIGNIGTTDSGAGHGGDSQREHRGTGPKGTKDDPVITKDPDVAENTDPDNQPGAPGGPDLTLPDAGGGIGGSAGGGIAVGTDANGNPVDANGDPVKDAVTGLGDVASKAFSDQFAGTPFSDPTQWPMTQSAGALLKFFGGLLTGSGGEGLGAFFPGGGKKGPSSIASRNAQAALDKKNAAIAKQQAKVAGMQDKPQFTDEAIQEQQDKLDTMIEDRDRIVANAQDRGIDLSGADTGDSGGWGPASQPGTMIGPFGPFNIGSPPPAPGGATNGGAIAPGGGWLGGSLPTGMIPSPADVQPPVAGPASNVTIDNSITQQVPLEGQANATDAANRAQNTQNASSMQTIRHIPGAMAT